jgi:hypothetical protein
MSLAANLAQLETLELFNNDFSRSEKERIEDMMSHVDSLYLD